MSNDNLAYPPPEHIDYDDELLETFEPEQLVTSINQIHGLDHDRIALDLNTSEFANYCRDLTDNYPRQEGVSDSTSAVFEPDHPARRYATAILEPITARFEQDTKSPFNYQPLTLAAENAIAEGISQGDSRHVTRAVRLYLYWGNQEGADQLGDRQAKAFLGYGMTMTPYSWHRLHHSAELSTNNPEDGIHQAGHEVILNGYARHYSAAFQTSADEAIAWAQNGDADDPAIEDAALLETRAAQALITYYHDKMTFDGEAPVYRPNIHPECWHPDDKTESQRQADHNNLVAEPCKAIAEALTATSPQNAGYTPEDFPAHDHHQTRDYSNPAEVETLFDSLYHVDLRNIGKLIVATQVLEGYTTNHQEINRFAQATFKRLARADACLKDNPTPTKAQGRRRS